MCASADDGIHHRRPTYCIDGAGGNRSAAEVPHHQLEDLLVFVSRGLFSFASRHPIADIDLSIVRAALASAIDRQGTQPSAGRCL